MLTACGGDGNGSDTTTVTAENSGQGDSGGGSATEAPSIEQFIQKADAICEDLNAQAGGLPTDTLPQIVRAAQASEEALSEGLARLGALEVPAEIETEFNQFIAAVEDQNAAVQRLGEAAAAGNVKAVQSIADEVQRARDRKSDIAIQAGFAECGSG